MEKDEFREVDDMKVDGRKIDERQTDGNTDTERIQVKGSQRKDNR